MPINTEFPAWLAQRGQGPQITGQGVMSALNFMQQSKLANLAEQRAQQQFQTNQKLADLQIQGEELANKAAQLEFDNTAMDMRELERIGVEIGGLDDENLKRDRIRQFIPKSQFGIKAYDAMIRGTTDRIMEKAQQDLQTKTSTLFNSAVKFSNDEEAVRLSALDLSTPEGRQELVQIYGQINSRIQKEKDEQFNREVQARSTGSTPVKTLIEFRRGLTNPQEIEVVDRYLSSITERSEQQSRSQLERIKNEVTFRTLNIELNNAYRALNAAIKEQTGLMSPQQRVVADENVRKAQTAVEDVQNRIQNELRTLNERIETPAAPEATGTNAPSILRTQSGRQFQIQEIGP